MMLTIMMMMMVMMVMMMMMRMMMMMTRKLTRIIVDIEISRDLYDVPGSRLPIVGEVNVVLVVEKTQ